MVESIKKLIDKLYIPVVARYVPLQTFRYGVCGGANMVLDAILYFLCYHYLLGEKILELPFVAISPEIAAYLIVFPIIYATGFLLAKYISFEGNKGRTSTQSLRYLSVVLMNIIIKYIGIKVLVGLGVFPSISNVLVTIFTIIFSYVMQRGFTFRINR